MTEMGEDMVCHLASSVQDCDDLYYVFDIQKLLQVAGKFA